MKIIEPSVEIITPINGDEILQHIELCGRICYKSENLITEDSAKQFVQNILNRGHESVLEHFNITVKIICDRGVLAELTRHRIASFSVESSRYCNYSKDKFGNELTFIKPCFWNDEEFQYMEWENCMEWLESSYFSLIELGAKPEEARSVLPMSLKTEIIMTANLRELRHILKLRTAKAAHPKMRKIMNMLLVQLKNNIPLIFDDIQEIQS
jgi:thymidylate synthase (FAD)